MKDTWLTKKLVKLAEVMMKPGFIVFFVTSVTIWISWNVLAPHQLRVDNWPFQALNLFMSALASIQATVVGIAMAISSEKYNAIIERTEKMTQELVELENLRNVRLQQLEEYMKILVGDRLLHSAREDEEEDKIL